MVLVELESLLLQVSLSDQAELVAVVLELEVFQVRDDNVIKGGITKLDFGSNLDLTTVSDGISTVSVSFPTYPYSGITTADITNWDTSYGWGDHSVVGYLTSYTERQT